MHGTLGINWDELKIAKSNFDFLLDFVEMTNKYYIYATDGIITMYTTVSKTDPRNEAQIDFEDNFKADCNKLKYGRQLVQSTARPEGTTSYFTGAGDDATNGIGAGNKLLFDMTANDTSKSVDIAFSETVWFKDGQIWCDADAPFGSYMDTEIVHPTYGVVGSFGRKIFLFNGWQPLDTEDRGEIAQGLSVRLTVHNADTPAAFKCIGRLEIYRETQV